MSRSRAARPTAATLAARAHLPAPTVLDDARSSAQAEVLRETARSPEVWAAHPVRRTPAGSSRIAAQVSFNDPSNYLG